jgi:hypothetical protein
MIREFYSRVLHIKIVISCPSAFAFRRSYIHFIVALDLILRLFAQLILLQAFLGLTNPHSGQSRNLQLKNFTIQLVSPYIKAI